MPTITEALAEIKTIDKRIAAKRDYVTVYLARQEGIKDPLAKEGGSAKVIERELQAIHDLGERKVELRRAINAANVTTTITIGATRSIADWITWRRDVVPEYGKSLEHMRNRIKTAREAAMRAGQTVVAKEADAARPQDVVVNLDEAWLAREIEDLTDTLGQLDGQLSLKNATTALRGV